MKRCIEKHIEVILATVYSVPYVSLFLFHIYGTMIIKDIPYGAFTLVSYGTTYKTLFK